MNSAKMCTFCMSNNCKKHTPLNMSGSPLLLRQGTLAKPYSQMTQKNGTENCQSKSKLPTRRRTF